MAASNPRLETAGSERTDTVRAGVAIVTGASIGLGRELALELARRGWRLVIDGRRADLLDATATELELLTTVVAIAGDVSDRSHREALARAASGLGPIDLLVNNASTLGVSPLPRLADIDAGVLTHTYEVNVVAPVALVGEISDALADRPTIVNITSDAGIEAYENWGGYGSSKAALEHVSRVLAEEQPTWRVLVVDPGDMRTEMHQSAFAGDDISDRPLPAESVPGIVALIEGHQPSGRYLAREVTR